MPLNERSTGRAGSGAAGRAVGWGLLLAAGLVAWLLGMRAAGAARSWRALLVSFVFFTPLAGALVTWSAVLGLCHARWPGPLKRLTVRALLFAPVSLVALAVLWAAAGQWTPWRPGEHPAQGVWLDPSFIFVRDLAALAVFWVLAAVYVLRRTKGGPLAGVLVLAYALVFSLVGMDLVMALDPAWPSSLFGAYFFVTGLYAAVAAWALLSVAHPDGTPDRLHDLGRLTVALSLVTTYMAFSQWLTIWFENLPHEAGFLLERLRFGGWQWVAVGLLCTAYLGPLVLLLARRAKRTPWFLGAVAVLVLAALWTERWWLVEPTFEPTLRLGLPELAMAAAFLGALGLAMEAGRRMLPAGEGEAP